MNAALARSRFYTRGGLQPGRASMAEFLNRIATKGDAKAFRELFEIYAPRVKAYMMRQGADATTAEELPAAETEGVRIITPRCSAARGCTGPRSDRCGVM